MSEITQRLTELGLDAEQNRSLADLSTYRVGGPARDFVTIHNATELGAVHEVVSETETQTLVVGKGSNLLVSDSGFDGLAIHLGKEFDSIEIQGPEVRAGALTFLPIVARKSVEANLTGFEWAVGVPGSVGGAVRMNAGGHGSDMATSLESVEVFDLSTGELSNVEAADLELSYRHSNLAASQVVLSALLRLNSGDQEQSKETLSEIVRWRRANQPGGQNAGSVFANPEPLKAAKLIDDAGLKGFTHGSASVSEKHANFIQATADGSADDVYAVIQHVKTVIAGLHGIDLRCENVLIGFE